MMTTVSAALSVISPGVAAFPYPYDWKRFPVAWFGGNATNFESEAQLDFIGKFSMAIFGWQHLIFATNWTASVYAQLAPPIILYPLVGN